MRATRLRTEYLKEPLGLDIRKPRFYWNCEGGIAQTAYQLVAARDGREIWNTGRVESDSMTHIPYGGPALHSRDCVVWKVRLWDEKGAEGSWAESWFEMGLLEADDWKARWITGDYIPKKNIRYPVDSFMKQFSLAGGVRKARLYATARGLYDVTINGRRVEDFILAPGITDYHKRVQYQVYNVTSLLKAENRLELRLADGWFRGSAAAYGVVNVFGRQTSLIAQLEITLEDGSIQRIFTDDIFAWSNDGPIRFADLKDGEIYEAGKTPGYAGHARVVDGPEKAVLTASNNVPVREREQLTPTLLTGASGARVLDFGQNIAGYLQFRVIGKPGQVLRLTCGEVLDADGSVDLSGVQETRPKKGWDRLSLIGKLLGKPIRGETEPTPKQEILFICSGGEDYYKTSFAVFGFRYVQVEGEVPVDPAAFTAIAVYSDMEPVGSFTCSNAQVNRLLENTFWSMKGNFLDIPTDCPTRERLGWTGDAQIFFDTGAYLMDTAAFFRKWLRDIEDSQYANGLVPAVVPLEGVEMMYKATGSSVGWADAIYLIPYRYYQRYGDIELLQSSWPMIEKYANYLMTHTGLRDKKEGKANPHNAYIYEKGVHLGEWLEPEEFRDKVYGTQARHPEEGTAYLYLAMNTIAEIANLLDNDGFAGKCRSFAQGAKAAYKALFVDTGTLDTNRQAKLVRPLALGLLDGEDRLVAQKRLAQAVEDYRYRVGTGFLSTPFLLPVLAARLAGRGERRRNHYMGELGGRFEPKPLLARLSLPVAV